MTKLKILLNNKWFFPVLMLYYGIFYILFGETYPFNGGLSTDGFVFASFIPDFTKSQFFDTYYAHRILPSLLVGLFLKLLAINSTEQNIYTAFQILNLVSIVVSCYFFKQLLHWFKISLKNQVLAFVLLLFNFGLIKYPFYLPVMTDTFALMLSIALLYFYVRNNIKLIIICTLLLAFTWPMGYYQGLILIAFPICILPFTPALKWQKTLIYGISILYISILSIYLIFIEKRDMTVDFVMKIDRSLLPFSLLGIIFLYFFFAKIFLNKTLLDIPLFLKKINYKRLLMSFSLFILVYIIIKTLHPNPNPRYTTEQTLIDPVVYSLIRPIISIVADTSYFGIVVCLLLILWSSFCKIVSQMGWGLVAAFGLNLFLFGITPQSRHLINILPWVIIFLVKALNKYSFSTSFYMVTGLLSLVASKIWLLLNIYEGNASGNFDKNGSMDFPDQILWMNIGPWMSEQMYYVQGGVMILFTGILFFMLYKFEVDKFNKLHLIRKFKILK
jgi:hypothetical protein